MRPSRHPKEGRDTVDFSKHFSTLATPQSEPARGDQVKNSAGGYAFVVDKWSRLDRFLVLGSEGGTYYATEQKLTVENAKCVVECAKEDGKRLVARIVEVSDKGLAPKNDPAIFALAIAAGADSAETRAAALEALPKVCRTATHLFHFVQAVGKFRRWGSGLRRAVARWYTAKKPEQLALQLVKYRQRDGWTHKDVLRLSHPHATNPEQQALFRYAVCGADGLDEREVKRGKSRDACVAKTYSGVFVSSPLVAAFEEAQKTKDESRLVKLILEHRLTHEMIPTEWKRSAHVWAALADDMPTTALVRNLGKMTEVGLISSSLAGGTAGGMTHLIARRITDGERLKKARVHPMSLLVALKTYQQGHGEKGKLAWKPAREIVDALDAAFYASFEHVEPTGKRTLLALDVSGSMGSPTAGLPLTCREASAAMAMVVARTEKSWGCIAFTVGNGGFVSPWNPFLTRSSFENGVTPLDISPRMRLDDVVRKITGLNFGNTDCALPMLYALEKKLEIDTFIVLTDNESWAGPLHTHQALAQYRRATGIQSKLVVLAMTATEFSVADPNDAGMLDVVGLSADVPQVIANFSRG